MEAKQAFESALDIVQQKNPQHPQVNLLSDLLHPMQTKSYSSQPLKTIWRWYSSMKKTLRKQVHGYPYLCLL